MQRRLFWEQWVSCHLSRQQHWLLHFWPLLQLFCCHLLRSGQGRPLHGLQHWEVPQLTQQPSSWVSSSQAASCTCY